MNIKFHLNTIIVFFLAITLLSCNKAKEKIVATFIANCADEYFTVDVVTNTDTMGLIGTKSIQLNIDSLIKAETHGLFNVSSVTTFNLKEFKLTLLNPDTANNFANFELGSVYFNTNTAPAPIILCYGPNLDIFSYVWIIPTINSGNMKNYLNGNLLTYNIYAKARRPTSKQLAIKMTIKFKVY